PRAAKGKGCPGYGSSGLSWRRGDRRTCCSLRIGEIQEQYYCLLLSRTAIYILLADLKKRLIKPIYTPTFYQHSINFAIGSPAPNNFQNDRLGSLIKPPLRPHTGRKPDWPKPLADSVCDSPTAQGGTLLLGLKLFNSLLHGRAHATGRPLNFLLSRPALQRQSAIGSIAFDPRPLLGHDLIALGDVRGV